MNGSLATETIERPELALVLGGAGCLWRDVDAILELVGGPWPGRVLAVNDVIPVWEARLDEAVTLHTEKLRGPRARWLDWRERRGGNTPRVWSNVEHHAVDRTFERTAARTSGAGAIVVARKLGGRRIALAGIPMGGSDVEERRHFFDPPGVEWKCPSAAWATWVAERRRLYGWVRSPSGRTRDLLGEPDERWLRADPADDPNEEEG